MSRDSFPCAAVHAFRHPDLGADVHVPRLRVPESSGADAIDVATREGVPQYPPTDARGVAIAPVRRAGRRCDPEVESNLEWVVYPFPGRQQQQDIPQGGLGRAENCNYGSDVSTSVPGGLLRNGGGITSYMTDVGCTKWWKK